MNQHTGVLTMSRVDQSDIGPLKCVAENKAGNVEVVVEVEVLVKPKIYELLNITSPYKTETRLICKASGRPAPSITFKKFGTDKYFVIGAQPDNDRYDKIFCFRECPPFILKTVHCFHWVEIGLKLGIEGSILTESINVFIIIPIFVSCNVTYYSYICKLQIYKTNNVMRIASQRNE